MKLHIIIPTHNRRRLLRQLLLTLYAQCAIDKYHVLFHIVVDGSVDGTLEMLQSEFPRVNIVVGSGGWWYTKSIIEGVNSIASDIKDLILLLNDDVMLHDNYIDTLIKDYYSLSSNAILGAISITTEDKRLFFSGVCRIKAVTNKYVPYYPGKQMYNENMMSGVKPTKVLPGRGMLFSFETYKKVGGFDECFLQYGSDEEFCLRAAKVGISSYITYNTYLLCYEKETGEGSLYNKQTFGAFIRSNLNKYSPNYILNSLRIIWRYQSKVLFPISFILLLGGKIKAFMKYQKWG